MLFLSHRIAMLFGRGPVPGAGGGAPARDGCAAGERAGNGIQGAGVPAAYAAEEDQSRDLYLQELEQQVGERTRELHLELEAVQQRAEQEHDELEKQLLQTQKLESLGVLAGGIAHDFNNLLMAISGNLELIRHAVGPESPAAKYVDNAFVASKRAADLARQMLAYPRKGGDSVKLLDLNRMVGENADLLKASVLKGVNLTAQLQLDLPLLEADPGQIQQLIINLLTNAAEAIGEGGGTIRVTTGVAEYGAEQLAQSRLEQKAEPGQYLFLEVADSGCGMGPEILERMFDPFFTTKLPGRGLGLAAVQGILRGHGGTVFVESKPQAGCTLRVLFPRHLT